MRLGRKKNLLENELDTPTAKVRKIARDNYLVTAKHQKLQVPEPSIQSTEIFPKG